MEIWLNNGVHDKLQFPVNPGEIGTSGAATHEDIVLASGNEATVIGGKNLNTYSLTSFFPKNKGAYVKVTKLSAPMTYVKKIEGWKNSNKVLQFQVTTTNINKQVTIRSFEWKEVGGAIGDIEFTIELKEYVPITYTSMISKAKPAKNTRPASTKTTSSTYVVKKGDCLWKISKKYYGQGSKWRKIYDKNKKIIGSNPNLIYPGQKLVIP